jgi:hypothetical protein
MPTLKIRISGLCFFAFDHPLKSKDRPLPKSAHLLLQKLTSARLLRNTIAGLPDVLEQHFPLLAFDLADRDAASTRATDFAAHPGEDGNMTRGLCLLFGDDVTIRPDGKEDQGDGSLEFDLSKPANPASPELTDAEKRSLFWLPTLEDAFPGRGAVASNLSQRKPGANQAILARVKLSRGTLKTLELSDVPCRFVPPGSPTFEQRVAIALCLEIPFQEWVEFHVIRRAEGREQESFLRLKPPVPGGDLDVDIKNMEIDELIGVKRFYSRGTVADFEVYSELLAQPVMGANGPTYLMPRSPGNPAGTGGLGTCPPGGS